MEKIDPRIELVIYRFLRGEISASEREMLESWLREGKHRELFEKICDKENILIDWIKGGRKHGSVWNGLPGCVVVLWCVAGRWQLR